MSKERLLNERQEVQKISKKHLNKTMRKRLLKECHYKWDTQREMREIPFKYGIVGVFPDDADCLC